jgi:hypothetical protein
VDHEGQPKESVFTRSLHGLSLRVPDDFADSPHEFLRYVRGLPHVKHGTASRLPPLHAGHAWSGPDLTGVGVVSLERRYERSLFSSIGNIKAAQAYAASGIGGLSNAGKGIKVECTHTPTYTPLIHTRTAEAHTRATTDRLRGRWCVQRCSHVQWLRVRTPCLLVVGCWLLVINSDCLVFLSTGTRTRRDGAGQGWASRPTSTARSSPPAPTSGTNLGWIDDGIDRPPHLTFLSSLQSR